MVDILQTLFDMTFGLIIGFIDDTLVNWTSNSLDHYSISIGFGSIQWFDINLYELFTLIGTIVIGIIFIVLIWKVFKFFTKLVNRAFGGHKW